VAGAHGGLECSQARVAHPRTLAGARLSRPVVPSCGVEGALQAFSNVPARYKHTAARFARQHGYIEDSKALRSSWAASVPAGDVGTEHVHD